MKHGTDQLSRDFPLPVPYRVLFFSAPIVVSFAAVPKDGCEGDQQHREQQKDAKKYSKTLEILSAYQFAVKYNGYLFSLQVQKYNTDANFASRNFCASLLCMLYHIVHTLQCTKKITGQDLLNKPTPPS